MSGRGRLRVYLGYAAGVGKTFAMLGEGHRRRDRGNDMVIGFVETHGRVKTEAQIQDLEVIPRRTMTRNGIKFEEMDVDAILARKPEVALVDELAHSNAPGSRNPKRWQDVEELLEAGITVITTLNIQHLESLNDVVERITGVKQRETIPDELVRKADQIELVDMSPWALRRRMAHGNIYPAEKVDVAMMNYFREGNLTALRELALLWLADRVEESLQDYVEMHNIREPWETRERVLVALSGRPEGSTLIRRASRIATRRGAELIAVHVVPEDAAELMDTKELEAQEALLRALGGTLREVAGDDIARALLDVARAEGATQLVLGSSSRSRWSEFVRGSVINSVIRSSGLIDVHVISSSEEPHGRLRGQKKKGLPRLRVGAGFAATAIGLPALTAVLIPLRSDISLSTILLTFLLAVVVISTVGGLWPGLLASIAASLIVNWYFTPPTGTLTIGEGENVVALLMFVGVSVIVSLLVSVAARRRAGAERARSEAQFLAGLAGTLVGADDPLPELLEGLRSSFDLQAAAILRLDDGSWVLEAGVGDSLPSTPEEGTENVPLQDGTLVLVGGRLLAEDRRILTAFAAQLSLAAQTRELGRQISKASQQARVGDLRGAILAAVSHDLRTPLASIKASVTSLRQRDVAWDKDQIEQFLATIEEETDRLTTLVGNLLDMSRLQAGAIQTVFRPLGLDEIVPRAIATVHGGGKGVDVEVPESLPLVKADASLLERALANLIDNALVHNPPDKKVRVDAGEHRGHVTLRVIDQGPGIKEEDRARVFEPFQRAGDGSKDGGTGLGLAVSKGFLETMGGRLVLTETPGGGLTAIVSLEVADDARARS
jgi:two-component system, OmpR family, sensor histidine kinase KdpD